MNKKFTTARALPAFLAVLLLVLSSASHIHLRFCLDGNDAPVSIHFESTDSHPQDHDDSLEMLADEGADIEAELSLDTLLAKMSKQIADPATAIPSNFQFVATNQLQMVAVSSQELLTHQPNALHPPSRAPPVIV